MGYLTTFSDDLARADENPWSDGGALDAGTTLQYVGAAAQANLQLLNHRIRMVAVSNTQDAITRVNTLALSANQWVSCRIVTMAGTAQKVIIGCLRMTADTLVNCYQVMALGDAGGVTSLIYKRVAGAGTQLATISTGSWGAGDVLRATAIGSDITAWKNDNSFLTVSDGTYASGPTVGWALSIVVGGAAGDIELERMTAGVTGDVFVFPRVRRQRRGLPIPFLR